MVPGTHAGSWEMDIEQESATLTTRAASSVASAWTEGCMTLQADDRSWDCLYS